MAFSERSHQPGLCWCGWEHTVSDAMINRARDLMCVNPKSTTEQVAHALFEDFHDLAKRDRVSDDDLRNMAMGHAVQIVELWAMVDKMKAEGK